MADEEEMVHDQLPTVQEIHSKAKFDSHNEGPQEESNWRKHKKIIAGGVIFFVIISVTGAIIGSTVRGRGNNGEEGPNTNNFFENLSSRNDIETAGSPQQLASAWILNDDGLQLPVPLSLDDAGASKFVSRYALAVLFYACNGSMWADNFNFLSGIDVCEWNTPYNDVLANKKYYRGVSCDDNNEPRVIEMPVNTIHGMLPTEIGLLTALKTLLFNSNQISGTLPSQLQVLSNLEDILLGGNDLRGTIPEWLGNLSNIKQLSLAGNSFQGTIPSGLEALSKLTLLSLSNNNLTGRLPEFPNMKLLKHIFLSNNDFEGPIPSWIGNNEDLEDLFLSKNSFSNTIPESFISLTNLRSLFLDYNRLSGNLGVLESLHNIEILLLENNMFDHVLNDNFLSSLNKLQILDASNNALKGSLPKTLFQMSDLEVIDLHKNKIEGSLQDFPRNSALQYLALYQNNLRSSIPFSITNLVDLVHLDLSSNQLTGTLPTELGSMKALTYLFLASNTFNSGPIPESLYQLTNLKELSLKETARVGPIPIWISDLSNLILLDLAMNELDGSIPPSFDDLENLYFLLLNHNKLSGTVPITLQRLPLLRVLLLDENNLDGLGKGHFGFCENLPHLGKSGSILTADCGGSNPSFVCSCCECCGEDKPCNDGSDFLANQDLVWDRGYKRSRFEFSDKYIFTFDNPNG